MRWADLRDGLGVPSQLFCWVGDPAFGLEAEATDSGWVVWLLDTGTVTSVDDFYGEVRAAWGLPPWFGDNLDALFDALRDAVSGPAMLVWDGSGAVERFDPQFAEGVVAVLTDAIAASDRFAVVLRADPLLTRSLTNVVELSD